MARPRTDDFWIDWIKKCARNERRLRPAAIGRLLSELLKRGSIEPPPHAKKIPHERTIRRVITEFQSAPDEEQRRYDWFSWPESMEAGLLPWEAGRCALDLVRHFRTADQPGPTVEECRWFWRVWLAAPELDPAVQVLEAVSLATEEVRKGDTERGSTPATMLISQQGKSFLEFSNFPKARRIFSSMAIPDPPSSGHSKPSEKLAKSSKGETLGSKRQAKKR